VRLRLALVQADKQMCFGIYMQRTTDTGSRLSHPKGRRQFGALLLILYGVIPTLQPANFGRVYAAYGGVFIVLYSMGLAG